VHSSVTTPVVVGSPASSVAKHSCEHSWHVSQQWPFMNVLPHSLSARCWSHVFLCRKQSQGLLSAANVSSTTTPMNLSTTSPHPR
jgi:hypothetical protein